MTVVAGLALVAALVPGLAPVERLQAAGLAGASFLLGFVMLAFVLGIQLFNPLCPTRWFRFACAFFYAASAFSFVMFLVGLALVLALEVFSGGIEGARPVDWAYSIAFVGWCVGTCDCALWMLKRPRAAA